MFYLRNSNPIPNLSMSRMKNGYPFPSLMWKGSHALLIYESGHVSNLMLVLILAACSNLMVENNTPHSHISNLTLLKRYNLAIVEEGFPLVYGIKICYYDKNSFILCFISVVNLRSGSLIKNCVFSVTMISTINL
jgi:hypothetical protein